MLLSLIATSCSFAQDTSLVKRKSGWAINVGSPAFIPTTDIVYEGDQGDYGIFDGYKYSFKIKPVLTFGATIDFFRYNVIYTGKVSNLALGYGIGYNQSNGQVSYSGYYEGGISYNHYEGEGNLSFKQYYIQPSVKLFYSNNFNDKNSSFFTGLSINANYLIRTDIRGEFKGYSGAGYYFDKKDAYTYWSYRVWAGNPSGIPIEYFINYEIGWSFPLKNKWLLIPTIKTSILNINRLVRKETEFHEVSSFEKIKHKYSKEVVVGIIIMYNR